MFRRIISIHKKILNKVIPVLFFFQKIHCFIAFLFIRKDFYNLIKKQQNKNIDNMGKEILGKYNNVRKLYTNK